LAQYLHSLLEFDISVEFKLSLSSLSKCGGINLYITGVTILESMVELISPPINTIAKGAISGLGFSAMEVNHTCFADIFSDAVFFILFDFLFD
jgi:hypothetical protein